MAAGTLIFLILTAILYKATSQQLCGCNGPGHLVHGQFGPNCNCMCPCPPPVVACPPPFGPQTTVITPSVISSPNCPNPVAATTIIDNTVSNALVNAIQLLIVSNLIENTINAGVLPAAIAPVCDTIINPIQCNPMEYVTVTPNIVGPCVCDGPIIDTCMPNVCGCGDFGPIPGYTLTEIMTPTFGPICGGCFPPMYSGVDCGLPTLAPVAAEVLFPSSIPAQLTCNFGYMNTNVPCVSVNVEPLPSFDTCCNPNMYNNGYFY